MMFNQACTDDERRIRDTLNKRTHEIAERWPAMLDTPGRCLYVACAGMLAGLEMGRLLGMNAGTSLWRRVPMRADDDDMDYFGYVFDGPAVGARRMQNTHPETVALPEMHVWNIDLTGKCIVDFTTGLMPIMCRQTIGCAWPGIEPPSYFWNAECMRDTEVDLPHMTYIPDQKATGLAMEIIARALMTDHDRRTYGDFLREYVIKNGKE